MKSKFSNKLFMRLFILTKSMSMEIAIITCLWSIIITFILFVNQCGFCQSIEFEYKPLQVFQTWPQMIATNVLRTANLFACIWHRGVHHHIGSHNLRELEFFPHHWLSPIWVIIFSLVHMLNFITPTCSCINLYRYLNLELRICHFE